MLPDSHAHLDDDAFAHDLDAVLSRARQAGVDRILAVGEDLASSRRAVELASQHEAVFAAVGIHPHRADQFHHERHEVKQLLTEDKVVAVGEIGLDAARGYVPWEMQTTAFREQLAWALERAIPVSVHNRDADETLLSALEAFPATAILHCFSGSELFAARVLTLGHFVSFAGNVTFKNSENLRAVARTIPNDRLLVESDAPVLAPQSIRGRRNEPAHVVEIASMLADIRSTSVERLAMHVSDNAARLFRWSSL